MDFAARLSGRMAELGVNQVELARLLTDRGIPTSKQVVNQWCGGSTRPEGWKRHQLFDALAIPLEERDAWTDALLARRDGNRPEPSPVP